MNMDQASPACEFVYSHLASDPDLREIVDLFVDEMPARVKALVDQLNAADWEGLRRTVHQLRGAAGSYGFDAISPCAGRIESAVHEGEPEERIRAIVDELVDLCGRVRCGVPS
jgi:histidine phosphotransfer protein HptB